MTFYIYLPHAIVMATAASVPDVFYKPNPFQGDMNYIKHVGVNQYNRLKFDNQVFSDMISAVNISFVW